MWISLMGHEWSKHVSFGLIQRDARRDLPCGVAVGDCFQG